MSTKSISTVVTNPKIFEDHLPIKNFIEFMCILHVAWLWVLHIISTILYKIEKSVNVSPINATTISQTTPATSADKVKTYHCVFQVSSIAIYVYPDCQSIQAKYWSINEYFADKHKKHPLKFLMHLPQPSKSIRIYNSQLATCIPNS